MPVEVIRERLDGLGSLPEILQALVELQAGRAAGLGEVAEVVRRPPQLAEGATRLLGGGPQVAGERAGLALKGGREAVERGHGGREVLGRLADVGAVAQRAERIGQLADLAGEVGEVHGAQVLQGAADRLRERDVVGELRGDEGQRVDLGRRLAPGGGIVEVHVEDAGDEGLEPELRGQAGLDRLVEALLRPEHVARAEARGQPGVDLDHDGHAGAGGLAADLDEDGGHLAHRDAAEPDRRARVEAADILVEAGQGPGAVPLEPAAAEGEEEAEGQGDAAEDEEADEGAVGGRAHAGMPGEKKARAPAWPPGRRKSSTLPTGPILRVSGSR